ncbi:MAG TPA: phage tail protein [Buttiauxella sp.]|jgi:hypothetical protein
MNKGWLTGQLTPKKQASPLWVELCDSMEEILQSHVEPLLARVKSVSSIFTMHEDDLQKRIDELGQFFAIRGRDKRTKPIVLAQRLDEIHLKDTDIPIVNTLYREFQGLSVTWEKLYAPVDQEKYPYGQVLMTKESVDQAGDRYGEWFLTSRGVIRVPINEVMRSFDSDDLEQSIADLMAEFALYIQPLVPLHIVFDGAELSLKYTIPELEDIFRVSAIDISFTGALLLTEIAENIDTPHLTAEIESTVQTGLAYPAFELHFDTTSLDAWSLDRHLFPAIDPNG